MVPRLSVIAASAALATLTMVGLAPTATAAEDDGRGREADTSATRPLPPDARIDERGVAPELAGPSAALEMPASYPHEPQLTVYQDNPGDASDTGGLLGHDDLAPMLMDLMETSNRLSVQVVGQSTSGRDLYLATVTAPETAAQTAQQTAWRELIKEDPEAAAADEELQAGYKTPIWISANIHGNEWEGTDAAMATIEDLVTAPWNEVSALLREHRIYFSLSLNPDGRTLGTRATAQGLDANRDLITNTTPETLSFIRTAHAIQPLYSADFHGYTRVLQVEPGGPPHGENYEYDLFLPQAYAMALAVEEDVVAAAIPGNTYFNVESGEVVPEVTGPETAHIKIPYRDTPSGWDDYPPIFTAQYAAFFGASTSTVELPKSRPNSNSQTPANAAINVAVAEQTMTSMIDYFNSASDDFLGNQIETFRRGVAGEAKDSLTLEEIEAVPGPDQWKPLWDVADNQDPVVVPRAYVIPVGDAQRSQSDARRLVEQLLLHDIEVGTLDAAATIAGKSYPAGSYVVDMHQPLRGLANSLLDLGTDISDKVPSMYDISAWSYSYLWGATVDKAGLTEEGSLPATTPVTAPKPAGPVPAHGKHLTFDLAGVADYQALNQLLEAGVEVAMPTDGSAIVGPDDRGELAAVASELDIEVEAASAADLAALTAEETRFLSDLTVAYVGNQDDRLSLTELGFDDLVAVNAASVNADPTLVTGADILWIGGAFSVDQTARDAIQAWVDAGHSIVGRTHRAFEVAASYGLVSGTVVPGNGAGNGIVAVDTPADSILAPYAQDHSFIYPAYWFTDLGASTTAAQTYDAEDPFLAGHWRAGDAGTDGPASAAGKASVVVGEAESGAKAVVFGTSVFFRTHPKGGLSQAARALFWAGPEGDVVKVPSTTTLKARKVAPRKVRLTVKVTVPGVSGDFRVVVTDKGEVLRRITVPESGVASVTVKLPRGTHRLKASLPAGDQYLGSTSEVAVVRIR
nr:M14 family zinc carboxypeptidase [Nocardioides thalensis]